MVKEDKFELKKHANDAILFVEPNSLKGTCSSNIEYTASGLELIFFSHVDPSKSILPGAIALILIPSIPKGLEIPLT